MTFKVRLTRDAEADLDRRFDFLLERALSRDGGDLSLSTRAIVALPSGIATLKASPFTCRKAGQSPFFRELMRASESAVPRRWHDAQAPSGQAVNPR